MTIAVALAALVGGCGDDGRGARAEVDAAIEAAQNGSPRTIDLREVFSGAWDALIVLRPYTDKATAEEALGARWDGYEPVGRDGACLLAFVNDGRVVEETTIDRSNADFCTAPATVPVATRIERSETVFLLSDTGHVVVEK